MHRITHSEEFARQAWCSNITASQNFAGTTSYLKKPYKCCCGMRKPSLYELLAAKATSISKPRDALAHEAVPKKIDTANSSASLIWAREGLRRSNMVRCRATLALSTISVISHIKSCTQSVYSYSSPRTWHKNTPVSVRLLCVSPPPLLLLSRHLSSTLKVFFLSLGVSSSSSCPSQRARGPRFHLG